MDGFPQVVSLKRMNMFSRLMQRLFGRRMTDRRDIKRKTEVSVFVDEFMIEIPLDIDISAILGVKNSHAISVKCLRPQDTDEHLYGGAL